MTTTTETVSVATVRGTMHLTPGVLDGTARVAFTNGQCTSFAIALAEATGWSIQGNNSGPEDVGFDHVWCVSPDGRYADVDGWHENPPAMSGSTYIQLLSPEEIEDHANRGGNPPLDVEVARLFIDPWLKENR